MCGGVFCLSWARIGRDTARAGADTEVPRWEGASPTTAYEDVKERIKRKALGEHIAPPA